MGRAISVSTVFGRGVSGMAWYKKKILGIQTFSVRNISLRC